MDDPNNTTGTLDQTDEDILTSTLSDEALEAAAGEEGGLQAKSIARPGSSPAADPRATLVAAARADCASALPTPRVRVPASTRAYRRRGRSCETALPTWATSTKPAKPAVV